MQNISKTQAASPQVGKPRLAYLDFIRGIAVLGLLLMNAPYMGVAEFGYAPFIPDVASDTWVRIANALFFDGRFRSMFCLLFGIGLYLQFQSYQSKGLNAYVVLKTRLWWLLLFGLLHCTLIWPGDILLMYALCGFVLVGQLQRSSEELLRKGVIWFAIGLLLVAAFSVGIKTFEPLTTRDSEAYQQAIAIATQGYFADWEFNLAAAFTYIITFPFLTMFGLCGAMFIGIGLFKSGKLKHGFNRQELIGLSAITLVVSIVDAVLASQYLAIWSLLPNVLATLSGLTMALLFWHLVLMTKVYQWPNKLVQAIKHVGTMAFTFYIFQSTLVTLLLQLVFPSWIETFSLLDYSVLAVCVMVLQLFIACLYKRAFNQGPLEYLWRQLVKRKVQTLQSQVTTNAYSTTQQDES